MLKLHDLHGHKCRFCWMFCCTKPECETQQRLWRTSAEVQLRSVNFTDLWPERVTLCRLKEADASTCGPINKYIYDRIIAKIKQKKENGSIYSSEGVFFRGAVMQRQTETPALFGTGLNHLLRVSFLFIMHFSSLILF